MHCIEIIIETNGFDLSFEIYFNPGFLSVWDVNGARYFAKFFLRKFNVNS